MVDSATGSDSSAGGQAVTFAGAPAHGLRHGYCADCGTWDSHGRVCVACGYDFAPSALSDAPDTET